MIMWQSTSPWSCDNHFIVTWHQQNLLIIVKIIAISSSRAILVLFGGKLSYFIENFDIKKLNNFIFSDFGAKMFKNLYPKSLSPSLLSLVHQSISYRASCAVSHHVLSIARDHHRADYAAGGSILILYLVRDFSYLLFYRVRLFFIPKAYFFSIITDNRQIAGKLTNKQQRI